MKMKDSYRNIICPHCDFIISKYASKCPICTLSTGVTLNRKIPVELRPLNERTFICKECDRVFIQTYKKIRSVFCSRECYEQYKKSSKYYILKKGI